MCTILVEILAFTTPVCIRVYICMYMDGVMQQWCKQRFGFSQIITFQGYRNVLINAMHCNA